MLTTKQSFCTSRFRFPWIRFRWWPLLAVGVYVVINVITFASIVLGGANGFRADTFWHAPLIWIFGG
jgi:hypothetical protein